MDCRNPSFLRSAWERRRGRSASISRRVRETHHEPAADGAFHAPYGLAISGPCRVGRGNETLVPNLQFAICILHFAIPPPRPPAAGLLRLCLAGRGDRPRAAENRQTVRRGRHSGHEGLSDGHPHFARGAYTHRLQLRARRRPSFCRAGRRPAVRRQAAGRRSAVGNCRTEDRSRGPALLRSPQGGEGRAWREGVGAE